MKILVTGGTGFIGDALLPALLAGGHEPLVLSRTAQPGRNEGVHYVRELSDLPTAVDAVINLAGASLAARRWNDAYKQEMVSSRVDLTRALGDYFRATAQQPSVWLNASAIGFYGPRGDDVIDESSTAGSGFAADLCAQWEAQALESAGDARCCLLRLGVVLDAGGGAYAQMAPPFRMGLANWIGDGQQWLSWVHRADVVRAMLFLLSNSELEGPVNVTAPQPVTSRGFCAAMRRVHRTLLAIGMPAAVMRLMVGEMADELLISGQKVVPTRLTDAGFAFDYPDLEGALRHIEG